MSGILYLVSPSRRLVPLTFIEKFCVALGQMFYTVLSYCIQSVT